MCKVKYGVKQVGIFVCVAVLAFGCVVFVAGCGGNSGPTVADYAGKYVFESSESAAGTYTAEDVSSMATPEQMCTLDLLDDNTFTLSTFGNSMFTESSTPTWEITQDGIKLSANGEEMPATYDTTNHTLTLTVNGSDGSTTTMVLKRTN